MIKKNGICIVFTICLLFSSCVYIVPTANQNVASSPDIVINNPKKLNFDLRITEKLGNVTVKRGGNDFAGDGQTLEPGDLISCGADGSCTVFIGEGDYFILDSDTSLIFEGLKTDVFDVEPCFDDKMPVFFRKLIKSAPVDPALVS